MPTTTKQLFESIERQGKYTLTFFRKVVSNSTAAGVWADLSYSPGNPVANFYATPPLVAATLDGNRGLYHGQAVAPEAKLLTSMLLLTASTAMAPSTYQLCDYLLYYPFIDMDSTDEQAFDNTVTLPRFATGQGVRAFLVAQGAYTGGAQFTIRYTNQAGVANRVSPIATSNVGTFAGSLVSSGPSGGVGPFIPLAAGDTGIRSVQSITFLSPNGGIAALVLCKPIDVNRIREVSVPAETDYIGDSPRGPLIADGAYLNFLFLPAGNVAATALNGVAEFAWVG